jgi:urea carboxylase-associated protein 2
MNNPIWTYTLRPGEKWSGIVGKGKLLRFTALGDNANLSTLVFNAEDKNEKYNMPDTLKAQHVAFLTEGYSLFSDNGRVLAGIIRDTAGWHDTISGYCTRAQVDEKYGKTTFQEKWNDWLRSGEENLLVELKRNGLGRRDLAAGLNLFAKVWCDGEGGLHHDPDHGKKDAYVVLRTEMNCLFVFSNTPNALDESEAYPSVPVKIEVFVAAPAGITDPCVIHSEESRRAYENTWEYYLLKE